MAYASVAELKERMGVPLATTTLDDRMAVALDAATEEIDDHCDRTFGRAEVVSERTFPAFTPRVAVIDDVWTTDGLVVAVDGAVTTEFELRPMNGVVAGRSGWPYDEVRFADDVLRTGTVLAPLTVTAKWGWPAVPTNVKEACLILAAETVKLADSPFGVGGYGEFGVIRARENPMAARRLRRYVKVDREPV